MCKTAQSSFLSKSSIFHRICGAVTRTHSPFVCAFIICRFLISILLYSACDTHPSYALMFYIMLYMYVANNDSSYPVTA